MLTFGRCGMPHLGVLQNFIQLGAGVLIRTCTTVAVVAVTTFRTEAEVHALLGGLHAFAAHAGVCAGEAALAFLQKRWSEAGRRTEKGGLTKIKPLTKELEGRSSREMAGWG